MRRLLLCVTIAGCGRIGFADLPPGDGTPVDGMLGPFGAPTLIGPLADPASDDDVTVTADQLELYFESERSGFRRIHGTTRPTLAAAWSTPTPVVEIAGPDSDTTPKVSGDGLTMMFASDRPGGQGGYDIYLSNRAARTAPWGTPILVPELSSSDDDFAPVVSATGLEVALQSTRAGGAGLSDIYLATRATTGAAWNPPVRIVELATALDDAAPFFSAGDLELWFAAERPEGLGLRDLYIATRPAIGMPFRSPVPVTEINTMFSEDDLWLSPDQRTLYFSSDRSGDMELHVATR